MTRHPDEGTLHAYIDGELPGAEAEALASHVAECASCSAALAEARGLAAGASRAISALDAAPSSASRPALPVVVAAPVPARRSARPSIFRAAYARAAALLLLVGGTAVVLDRSGTLDREESSRFGSLAADAAPAEAADGGPVPDTAALGSEPAPALAAGAARAAPANTEEPTARRDRPGKATGATSRPTAQTQGTTAPAPVAAVGAAADAAASVRRTERAVAAAPPAALAAGQEVSVATSVKRPPAANEQAATTVAPTPPPPPARLARPAEVRLEEVVVTGLAELSVSRVTRYRTSDGKILTLTEEPLRTRFAEESTGTQKIVSARSQQSTAAAAAAPVVNSYQWSSAEKGLRYTLTGPLTVPELEALSKRLSELERVP